VPTKSYRSCRTAPQTSAKRNAAHAIAPAHHHNVWALVGVDPPTVDTEILESDFYPDAVPCLHALAERGLRIGLAGNQPERSEPALARLGLPISFVASSARWDVEKPDPGFFEQVICEAGVPPRRSPTSATDSTTT
jgi:FMN phosphatase YigB (HAD superfamily)